MLHNDNQRQYQVYDLWYGNDDDDDIDDDDDDDDDDKCSHFARQLSTRFGPLATNGIVFLVFD